jgi:ribosomal protein L7/L12
MEMARLITVAARGGHQTVAIKMLREATNIGLTETKRIIENF